ncbi:MAG: putative porin [Janthinobacterium lividum]
MIQKQLKFLLLVLLCASATTVSAQYGRTTNTNTNPFVQGDTSHRTTAKPLTDDQLLDTLRKRDEHKADSVIFTSKFIRVTNERLLNDSTQVLPLDTTLNNFENYSSLYQPRSPKIGLGNLGLSYRNLLFEPTKAIGFDVGLHFLDAYVLKPEDITYYRARTPFTNLYYVNGALKEQVFRITHTQNIKPNWNAGFNFNRIGSVGFYPRQKSDHLEAAVFTWYESKNKRYNLLGNLTFNNLKSPENGSILNDTIFVENSSGSTNSNSSLSKSSEPVRLNNSRDNWRDNSFYIKQFYYIGRTEGLKTSAGSSSSVLPTQRVSHTFTYNSRQYKYLQDEADLYNVFPTHLKDTLYSRDSLSVKHLRNEFSYSFYLRGNAVKFVRNELKLDLGLVHDYYKYSQYVRDTLQVSTTNYQLKVQNNSFQDITLKARLGYNLSDRAGLDVNLQQVTLGREFGDYLYDARLNILLGNKIGRVMLEGYTQSNTPPLIYTNWSSSHYQFSSSNFSKTKTTSLSFNYLNEKLQVDAKAEYFLLNNYLYFLAKEDSNNPKPKQAGSAISLLKFSLAKNFAWRSLHLDNFLVYQKTDNTSILRTPEFYTYNSFYYVKRFFNVLSTNIGFTVRYNSKYLAQSYAPGIGQFYNNSETASFPTYPVIDLFIKGTLRRTNLFLKYDYANQGLLSKGFYTVRAPGNLSGYPMQDALLKFGVSWNFYD